MEQRIGLKLAGLSLAVAMTAGHAAAKEPVDWVNTRIGNISHLLVPTFPAVQLPNGLFRFTPPMRSTVTDTIDGIPLHLPAHRNPPVFRLRTLSVPRGGDPSRTGTWKTTWDHQEAKPYHYTIFLDAPQTTFELAPGRRTAVAAVGFEADGAHGLEFAPVGGGELAFADGALTGWDTFNKMKVWIHAEFDRAPARVESRGKGAVALWFGDAAPERVAFRYAVSYIDAAQAARNLRGEQADFDLARVADVARAAWNEKLSKIEVDGGTDDEKTVFYTSLWRCYERMVNITEDGRYFSAWDGKVHDTEGTDFWTDDWVWDSFRAHHPLMVILEPAAEAEKIRSYIRMGEQSGRVPTFPVPSGDNHCMNGRHYVAVALDAWRKGVTDWDLRAAYDVMKRSMLNDTMLPWRRAATCELDEFYWKNGYFPALAAGEKETCETVHHWEKRQAVAVTLAQAYDSWCLAEMAKTLGLAEDEAFFRRDAQNYRNLWNEKTRFFHPRTADGRWVEPFDYKYSGGQGARDYYDENNGWTYRWDVAHDIPGLIALFDGAEKFVTELDRLFAEPPGKSIWEFYNQLPDSTGLTGMFVMGNEPSFHIPYLYNYAGCPWKTQKRVRMLLDAWFRNDLMGVCGDEDGGGMSAFAVFSMMGFYPVTPGRPDYCFGSPVFTAVRIRQDNGKVFTLAAPAASRANKYIHATRIDGKTWDAVEFPHSVLTTGGRIDLDLRARRPQGRSLHPATAYFVGI